MNWYPIAHTPTAIPATEDFFQVGIVLSGSSVLTSRQSYLQEGGICQEYWSRVEPRCRNGRQRISKSDDRNPGCLPQQSHKKQKRGKNQPLDQTTRRKKASGGKSDISQDHADVGRLSRLEQSWSYGVFIQGSLILVNILISLLCCGQD